MDTASLLPPQSELDSPHDPLISATLELERCARLLDLEYWIVERLRHCEQETVTNFLLAEDNGQTHPVTAIVARHCTVPGHAVVPFQVSRDVYRNSVCADAMRMTFLCALYGLNFGGGAAGLILDPKKHNERELHKAVTGFAESARESLATAGMLVPQGVHGIEMDWLEAGLSKAPGAVPVIAGKASSALSSRNLAIALGLGELTHCAARTPNKRIAAQGFDENIRALLLHLHGKGARIVAVADESGGLKHDLGLDPEQLEEHVRNHGVLLGYPEGNAVLNVDVLEAECDVLILAGGDRQINAQNVNDVKASVVIAVAPGAVTEGAAKTLCGNGKVFVSDLMCAGPALLQCVAEAKQIGSTTRQIAWMRRQIRDTWRAISEASERWNVPISEAARALAVQRVAAILRAQGSPF